VQAQFPHLLPPGAQAAIAATQPEANIVVRNDHDGQDEGDDQRSLTGALTEHETHAPGTDDAPIRLTPPAFLLDVAGALEGTDKCSSVSFAWDYLRKYEDLFAPLRDQKFNLIEIGVFNGTSLKMWKSFFPRATIVGIDINPACTRHAEERVVIKIGSQEDPELLAKISARYPPTIIIDDGSHVAHHIIYTFERLYPSLLPGGFYVVEDLAYHCGEVGDRWKGVGGMSPPAYFFDFMQARLARRPNSETNWGTQKYVFENTDALTVIDSAVILQKRRSKPLVNDVFAFAETYLGEHPNAGDAYERLTEYVLRHYGTVAEAEMAARRALDLKPGHARVARRLADILLGRRKFDEAAIIAREVAAQGGDAAAWAYLGSVELRRGKPENAEAALEMAIELDRSQAQFHRDLSTALEQQDRLVEALAAAEAGHNLAVGSRYEADYTRRIAHLRARTG
jgi:hypothetical protein